MVSVNLVANTDLRTAEEFRQLVVKEQDGVVVRLGEIADVVLGAENYEQDVRFNGEAATFMGVWVLPTANTLDVIAQRPRARSRRSRRELPAGMQLGIAVRLDRVHQGRHRRGDADAHRDAADRHRRHLPVPRLVPIGADSDRRDSGVARRRGVPDAGRRLHDQPADAARDRALGRPRGGRRDRRWWRTSSATSTRASARCGPRSTRARELVGPIIAMTITLAAVYTPVAIQGGLTGVALPRVRADAGGRGSGLGRRRADAVADDVREAAARRRHRSRLCRLDQRRFDALRRRLQSRALASTLRYRPVVLTVWVVVTVLIVPFYLFSQQELAPYEDQGFFFGVVQSSANSTLDQTKLFADQIYDVYRSFPESGSIFQITYAERRLRRHDHEAVEPADQDDTAADDGVDGSALDRSPASGDSAGAAAAAGRRQLPGRSRDRLGRRAAATDGARRTRW